MSCGPRSSASPCIWTPLRLSRASSAIRAWLIIDIFVGAIAQIVAFVLLDGDLIKHDRAEGAVEAELAAIYARLGQTIPAPDPSRVKDADNYVARIIVTIVTCGIYMFWWWVDQQRDCDRALRRELAVGGLARPGRPEPRSPSLRCVLSGSAISPSDNAPSSLIVVGGEVFEVGDDRGDVVLGAGDTGPAHLDQLAGPPDPLREHVDVELVALELVEDRLELLHGVGVADRFFVTHRLAHSTDSSPHARPGS